MCVCVCVCMYMCFVCRLQVYLTVHVSTQIDAAIRILPFDCMYVHVYFCACTCVCGCVCMCVCVGDATIRVWMDESTQPSRFPSTADVI